jgi:hypothetical protein
MESVYHIVAIRVNETSWAHVWWLRSHYLRTGCDILLLDRSAISMRSAHRIHPFLLPAQIPPPHRCFSPPVSSPWSHLASCEVPASSHGQESLARTNSGERSVHATIESTMDRLPALVHGIWIESIDISIQK